LYAALKNKTKYDKPVADVVRSLLTVQTPSDRTTRSGDRFDAVSYPANFTPPMRESLIYATRCNL